MSRTITAMFDSRSDAEAAKARLASSSIDADNVRIIDQSSSGDSTTLGSSTSFQDASRTGTTTSGEGHGFWASLKDLFLPDDDRSTYAEGINRGGFLLTAQVDEDQADGAINILDEANSIDIDEREQSWRSTGWSGYDAGTTGLGVGAASLGTTARTDNTVEEERIPIVEEQIRVGKREVARGGARVRSYVREVPVHEQVSLREEHVSVERRPVSESLSTADLNRGDLLQERTIEMRETSEEAVIGKQAVVTEEVVVRKTAEERVEQIDDTVRRTEVEVDEGLREGSDRPALGGFGTSGTAGVSGSTGTSGTLGTDDGMSNLTDKERLDKAY